MKFEFTNDVGLCEEDFDYSCKVSRAIERLSLTTEVTLLSNYAEQILLGWLFKCIMWFWKLA